VTALDRHHWSRPPTATDRDRHDLGVLDRATCLRLLGSEPVGRLGFSAGSLPVIHPVNYLLHGDAIVFRSEDGEKVRAAEQAVVACLEIDRYDRLGHTGWSVLATGRLSLVPADRTEALRRLPLAPWAIHGADRFVELSLELVSGRTIGNS
jgi:nitroimidazol reductase NimA-like FMN-containing flavoprotein (pyridoxamine 5'-phosphate oxidase superfamily)